VLENSSMDAHFATYSNLSMISSFLLFSFAYGNIQIKNIFFFYLLLMSRIISYTSSGFFLVSPCRSSNMIILVSGRTAFYSKLVCDIEKETIKFGAYFDRYRSSFIKITFEF